MTRDIKGCGTALVTPFRDDGSVDEAALAGLVEWQISEGIHFLVPCGTTGESVTLTHGEYMSVVETVVRTAGGKVPVIAGAGGNNTSKVIELARELERRGVDGILSVTPYYNKPTQDGIFQHFSAIAASIRLPVVVYNVPGRTGSNVLPETLLRLSAIENICAVKEASGDISQIGEICTRVPPDFRVLSGDDALTLPLVALGGHGVISVASNEAPGMMARLTEACLAGRWDEARERNRKLYPLMRVNFVESNPIPVKAALSMMGRIRENYRLPMVPISDTGRARLRSVLEQTGLL